MALTDSTLCFFSHEQVLLESQPIVCLPFAQVAKCRIATLGSGYRLVLRTRANDFHGVGSVDPLGSFLTGDDDRKANKASFAFIQARVAKVNPPEEPSLIHQE
jgi:hypothetical protein